tara:strand:+ start:198 stop:548 length:351 start_codon:yes stop_codon:yes gene_type:complete
MINKLFITVFTCLLFTNCTGVKTVSSGLENESFLEFAGDPRDFAGGVDVNIDDKITFKAEINKVRRNSPDHAKRPKGKAYAISTGAHVVSVSYNNTLIFKKKIFISAQETRTIILQ